jgi:hypothetical protein
MYHQIRSIEQYSRGCLVVDHLSSLGECSQRWYAATFVHVPFLFVQDLPRFWKVASPGGVAGLFLHKMTRRACAERRKKVVLRLILSISLNCLQVLRTVVVVVDWWCMRMRWFQSQRGCLIKGLFGTHHFILFGRNKMTWWYYFTLQIHINDRAKRILRLAWDENHGIANEFHNSQTNNCWNHKYFFWFQNQMMGAKQAQSDFWT